MAERVVPSSTSKGKTTQNVGDSDVKPLTPGVTGHPALKLSNTIEKLKPPGPDSNYLDWSWIIDMHFSTTGVEYIINPADKHPQQSATFAHNNTPVCISVIAQTINPANIRLICNLNKDGQKLWQVLKTAHQDSSSGGVMYYMRKLFLSHLQDNNIDAHLNKMSSIFERLNTLSNPDCPLNRMTSSPRPSSLRFCKNGSRASPPE
jgi:hypothetical protein